MDKLTGVAGERQRRCACNQLVGEPFWSTRKSPTITGLGWEASLIALGMPPVRRSSRNYLPFRRGGKTARRHHRGASNGNYRRVADCRRARNTGLAATASSYCWRALAVAGIPAMRFDTEAWVIPAVRCGISNRSAPTSVRLSIPSLPVSRGLQRKWCCGACAMRHPACLFYARRDPRISGLVLLNPWVRTDAGWRRPMSNINTRQRLLSREFWGKLLGGGVVCAARCAACRQRCTRRAGKINRQRGRQRRGESDAGLPLPQRMLRGFGNVSKAGCC